jgi:hypothetical protein
MGEERFLLGKKRGGIEQAEIAVQTEIIPDGRKPDVAYRWCLLTS